MFFEQIKIGGDRNFAYIVGSSDSGEAALVDPAHDPARLLARCAELNLQVKYLINTHDHPDHTGGNGYVLQHSDATLVGFGLPEPAIAATDGLKLHLGKLELLLIHTPGHTPDSICILAEDILITGDTLFVGKVGGTTFGDDARQEYHSLHEKLMTLPDTTRVYPGHDYGVRPTSTIGDERVTNPFIMRESFESFLDLKVNWAEYKKEHGIA